MWRIFVLMFLSVQDNIINNQETLKNTFISHHLAHQELLSLFMCLLFVEFKRPHTPTDFCLFCG